MNYENDQELKEIIEAIKNLQKNKNTVHMEFDYKGEKITITAISKDQNWGKREDKEKREYLLFVDNEELKNFIEEKINN